MDDLRFPVIRLSGCRACDRWRGAGRTVVPSSSPLLILLWRTGPAPALRQGLEPAPNLIGEFGEQLFVFADTLGIATAIPAFPVLERDCAAAIVVTQFAKGGMLPETPLDERAVAGERPLDQQPRSFPL